MQKINSSKDFGLAVKNQRKIKGYTQQYICDVTGLSVSFISNLENGKPTCELDKAIQVANLVGLDFFCSSR